MFLSRLRLLLEARLIFIDVLVTCEMWIYGPVNQASYGEKGSRSYYLLCSVLQDTIYIVDVKAECNFRYMWYGLCFMALLLGRLNRTQSVNPYFRPPPAFHAEPLLELRLVGLPPFFFPPPNFNPLFPCLLLARWPSNTKDSADLKAPALPSIALARP